MKGEKIFRAAFLDRCKLDSQWIGEVIRDLWIDKGGKRIHLEDKNLKKLKKKIQTHSNELKMTIEREPVEIPLYNLERIIFYTKFTLV